MDPWMATAADAAKYNETVSRVPGAVPSVAGSQPPSGAERTFNLCPKE